MTDTRCICGCNEPTKGGSFRPGHDAKYKTRLINEAIDGRNPEAERILEERGWTKFLDKRREVVARPARKPAEPATQTNGNGDLLSCMKAAAKVLRWTGQYSRSSTGYVEITADNVVAIARLEHPDLTLPAGDHPTFTEKEESALARHGGHQLK